MLLLYYIAEQENRLVVGTTNKSEIMVGSLVKWGDNVAHIELIAPLYKTQVRQLAVYLGVMQKIIDKPRPQTCCPGSLMKKHWGSIIVLDTIVAPGRRLGISRIVASYSISLQTIGHVQEMARRSWGICVNCRLIRSWNCKNE